ncbi:phage regulatory CII family protein [Phytobacter diazotrophicus]
MFDFQVSKQPHYADACRAFALRHNLADLARRAGMNEQTLRNKLNPEQPHHLYVEDIWLLTDLTEDPTLVDGFLAQMHCLPCTPINELTKDKLSTYVMQATAHIGQIAANTVANPRMTLLSRRSLVDSANSGMRCLALAAMAVDARLKTNPAMASAIDTVTGLGASFGLL